MKYYLKLKFFFLFIIYFSLFFCYGESFRTHKTNVIDILLEDSTEKDIAVGINDSVLINLPNDLTFFDGVEIKVKIPSSVSNWTDSVACAVYDSISPKPSSSLIDYSGKRIFLMPLPQKANWILQIPFYDNKNSKDNSYITKLNVIPNLNDRNIFVRFMPVMKGVPEETLNAVLNLHIKPLLQDNGRLYVYLKASDENEIEACTILIDDIPVSLKDNSIILKTGSHSLSIQSEKFRNEVRSIYIDQAKNTECEIQLKSLTPFISISAPDNAQIFFDNNKVELDEREFEISEGEHKLKFLIGSYEIIRTINALKGKSYNANLTVDLQITEE